jgi:hypothetical protein
MRTGKLQCSPIPEVKNHKIKFTQVKFDQHDLHSSDIDVGIAPTTEY